MVNPISRSRAHADFKYNFPKELQNVTVGFDRMFDALTRDWGEVQHSMNTNFPPYNLRRDGDNKYVIELAVAGFSKDDIKVHLENGVLSVESKDSINNDDKEYVHQGIAKRSFKRSWTLSDDIEVKHADLIDGMLTIELEKIFPEGKEPREIPIGAFKE
jgi:molecular chaperone IbpA